VPELPECERARRILEELAVGRRIARVRCADDRIVFDGIAPRAFARALAGREVAAARRRGKYLWLELETRPWPLFHFGMAGGIETPGRPSLRLSSSPRAEESAWPPRFTKARIELDDGGEVVLTDRRRLARIRLRDDPISESPVSELGFDPLLDPPSPAAFAALVATRSVTLKGLLLDQGFAAGVGNWLADEILYQARLDPRRRADSLAPAEARRLRTTLLAVVRRAVAVDADKARFPRKWLFHHRWGKVEGARTASGERIEHITVAGRTTAWVPEAQGTGSARRRVPVPSSRSAKSDSRGDRGCSWGRQGVRS
jgi:formamidopyrimidine-DNA glycosylase